MIISPWFSKISKMTDFSFGFRFELFFGFGVGVGILSSSFPVTEPIVLFAFGRKDITAGAPRERVATVGPSSFSPSS
jgi:hypothetical protein